jgi:hypothetical protein
VKTGGLVLVIAGSGAVTDKEATWSHAKDIAVLKVVNAKGADARARMEKG